MANVKSSQINKTCKEISEASLCRDKKANNKRRNVRIAFSKPEKSFPHFSGDH